MLERVGQVERADFLGILELQKFVAAVAGHVHQNIAPLVGQQALAPGHLVADAIGQQANEVLDGDFVAAVVDLDVVAVQVDGAVRVAVDGAGEGVARVAGHVVGKHEDDLGVGDAEALDGAVDGEHVGYVAVVEPEARRADDDGPVAGVLGQHQGGRECREGQLEDARGLHGDGPDGAANVASAREDGQSSKVVDE